MTHDWHHGHEHEPPQGMGPMRGLGGHLFEHWGGGQPFGGGGWGGGRRMRRGGIRRAILWALRSGPAHGYEVMRRLEEMSGGLWRPSPGSVYPHLQMLEDEGIVSSTEVDGNRTFSLTSEGENEAAAAGGLPWQADAEGDNQIRALRQAVTQLLSAAKQLSSAGAGSQVERGIAVIQTARKELYQILAED
ncbi:MAG TPA: PadR family transcriptional regulator [Acidimicrobiales bacterium]|nr:PadR family transcriptional regulator [Acidimicrobiales bacterium]